MSSGYVHWLRSHIGPRKTILAYATALIRDAAGRLLFQRRTDFEWWGLPGGALELGETFAECAVREAAEETGWQVQPLRLVGLYAAPQWDVYYPNGDAVHQFTVAIECHLVGGCSQPDGQETTASQFFAVNDLPDPCPPWYAAMACDLWENRAAHFDPPVSCPAAESYLWPLRRAVGSSRLIMMGAAAVIQDACGQVLLGLRSDSHEWGLPAGHMELGETPAGTVVREVCEELRLHIRPTQLVGVFTGPTFFHMYPDGNQVQIASALFRAEIEGGTLAPDGDEILAAQWFDPADLPPMPARHRWLLRVALANPQGGQFA